jgi:phenylalanyl-tRNA synthetase beta chain
VKISLDWISDFVDLAGIEPAVIAEKLTISTAEVEGFEVLRRTIEGVVVGEVVSVEPIASHAANSPAAENSDALATQTGGAGQGTAPAATKLHKVAVDCGGKRYASVCGAPNVRVGMKAAFAPAGVTLVGGHKIAVSEVGGHRSEGILCSAAELGMSRWHEVLLECPASIPNGTPLSEFVPATDVIIEIDNKSLTHRPDLWGHYGIARELAAIFKKKLKPLPMVDLAQYDRLPAYSVKIDDLDGCPCYGCIEFSVHAAVPSPLAMQRRLHALGQRTFNLLVDVTNYAMLELAQPTHAFDGDALHAVRVAKVGHEGRFTTLDGQERRLAADDLLIWNEKEPVALAGIMGGLESEVRPETTRLLLESANFKGSRIRRTSVRLDLRSEAAQRFEKSQPPANVKLGIARILQLLTDAGASPKVTSRFSHAGDLKDKFRPLAISRKTLHTLAGKSIPDAEVVDILHALGFEAEFAGDGQLQVGVPPHRSEKDISIPEDIVEEVLRVYGYGRIEPKMPAVPMDPVHVETNLRIEHKIRRLLAAGHGFAEVHNYSWFDDNWIGQIGFEPKRALVIKNPSTQQNRLMRTTMTPNMLALAKPNRSHRDSFRLFELGRVYTLADDGRSIELPRLVGMSFHLLNQPSLEEHFCAIKGVLEDLAVVVGCGPFEFTIQKQGDAPWETPGYWVAILCGGKRVGSLGALSGPLLETVAVDGQVIWFELELDQITGPIYPELKYAAPPIYPGSWQDFSLVCDVAQGFAGIDSRLAKFKHALIMRREFLYVFKGKSLPPGKASYSFRFWIGSRERTLTSEDIEGFRTELLKFLEAESLPLRT